MRRLCGCGAACCAAMVLAAAVAEAGPLNPPPGPVAPSYKTLEEVEPRIAITAENTPGDADSVYRIAAAGSYYLTENLVVSEAKAGIEIAASNVTIDLMGYTVEGDGSGGVSLDGIRTGELAANVTVRNGVVARFGEGGIDLAHAPGGLAHIVEGIRASENGEAGIVAPGGVVRRCTAFGNLGDGIDAGSGSLIEDCSSSVNSGANLRVGEAARVSGCVTIGGGNSIVAGSRCVVSDSVALGGGIVVGDGTTVDACTANGNPGTGIETGVGCTVVDCTVNLNTGIGILAGDGSTVAGCTVRRCALDGISVENDCTVRGNTSSDHGDPGTGAGVRVTGSGNRVEGNHCNGNDWGFVVEAGGNVIVRNTCSGNTTSNWEVAAGNVCLVRQAATAGAISGDSGGTAPAGAAAIDPEANFTY